MAPGFRLVLSGESAGSWIARRIFADPDFYSHIAETWVAGVPTPNAGELYTGACIEEWIDTLTELTEEEAEELAKGKCTFPSTIYCSKKNGDGGYHGEWPDLYNAVINLDTERTDPE